MIAQGGVCPVLSTVIFMQTRQDAAAKAAQAQRVSEDQPREPGADGESVVVSSSSFASLDSDRKPALPLPGTTMSKSASANSEANSGSTATPETQLTTKVRARCVEQRTNVVRHVLQLLAASCWRLSGHCGSAPGAAR